MLNSVSDEREKELQDLQDFTDNIRKEITNIASTLNWTIESIADDNENCLICPYNSSHRLTKESLNDHLISCQWKAEGYDEFDVPLSETALPSNSPYSIKLDRYLQNNILLEAKAEDPNMKIGWGERLVPCTSNRLITDFTPDERRALYEYAISNTAKADIGCDITDTHKPKSTGKEDKELSFLELILQERNLKRRRVKHRGVHTNKKSHIEILREVINQQMELYTDYLTETCGSTHGEETAGEAQLQDPRIDANDILSNSSHSFQESSSRHYDTLTKEANVCRPSAPSRCNDYERTMDKHVPRSRDREKRDKHSPLSRESAKKHKRHDEHRKRSRSRDRKSSKKDKHRSRSHGRRRDESHSKRNGDRRKHYDYYKPSNDY